MNLDKLKEDIKSGSLNFPLISMAVLCEFINTQSLKRNCYYRCSAGCPISSAISTLVEKNNFNTRCQVSCSAGCPISCSELTTSA